MKELQASTTPSDRYFIFLDAAKMTDQVSDICKRTIQRTKDGLWPQL